MRRGKTWLRTLVVAPSCCLVVAGCGTTTPEEPGAPFSSPPPDCVQVQAIGKNTVSNFAGNLYDPKLEFRSERPEQEFAEVLTCYGAYTADGQQHPASGADPQAATVFITITVKQKDSFSGNDVVDDTKRSFASYRDQHANSAKIISGLGDDAYTSKEATGTDARAAVDFRVGNATLHVRLNKMYPQGPTPQHESDLESNALALAHALAADIDGFM